MLTESQDLMITRVDKVCQVKLLASLSAFMELEGFKVHLEVQSLFTLFGFFLLSVLL